YRSSRLDSRSRGNKRIKIQISTPHIQIAPASLSFSTNSVTLLTFTPTLRTGGSAGFITSNPGLMLAPLSAAGFSSVRLFFRLHDIGQGRIARLVEPQIGGDDRGRFQFYRLQAAVDLARDRDRIAVERHLGRESTLRPAEQRGQHLSGLIAIVVDCLLA